MTRQVGLATSQTQPCHFSVYRSDEVAVTSTLFAGGDWHWCLADFADHTLVDSGGYSSEQECRQAVSILQKQSASAAISLDWSQSRQINCHEL